MNKPSYINLRPYLNLKVVDLNGITFSNKNLIQAAIYMSPTISEQILENGSCNSIVCTINPDEGSLVVNFMQYSKVDNNTIKDMRYHGILDQDAYDEQICGINTSCYDNGMYTFALSAGYLIDNFDLQSSYTEDKYVVLVPFNDDGDLEFDENTTIEEFNEELEDFENCNLTETIIIPFDAIREEFVSDPEIF